MHELLLTDYNSELGDVDNEVLLAAKIWAKEALDATRQFLEEQSPECDWKGDTLLSSLAALGYDDNLSDFLRAEPKHLRDVITEATDA
ncbi:hypothetical protein Pmar_PMAR027645 [Perkinsus marinus ATCC 50983]|uniref:Uncharacterized protein n=1 Tax=Perkinsus marinus (strain ATCC 50983 / TXsc) TaxID=423536 RepID=C5KCB6_PERM5|nr:hypothetical protein Pmar_PMAR027645 [Perkinsus marinus ATCC 50983]EER17929.1 hypothetical protein Pmar_PMAR027645 [Perkinsus marinus ATCC 50983]|eukprot:XP_002786133.1 hypothetical protein Pmar_PMAR027645 [Perkinsus marinus ATCC 50983]